MGVRKQSEQSVEAIRPNPSQTARVLNPGPLNWLETMTRLLIPQGVSVGLIAAEGTTARVTACLLSS